MSWYNQEDWVHIDDYADVVAERDELKRQLKIADEDELYLEGQISELRDANANLLRLVAELQAEKENV